MFSLDQKAMPFRLNMKRTPVLERIQLLEQAITKAKEYLESGKHAHWIGFRPLFDSKFKEARNCRLTKTG